jgi:hypothetical protein
MIKKGREGRQVPRKPVWYGARQRWNNHCISPGMSQRILVEKFDMGGDLLVGGRGHIITSAGVANEVQENGSNEHMDICQCGKCTGEYASFCAVQDLIRTSKS